jgi:hypothetical protein
LKAEFADCMIEAPAANQCDFTATFAAARPDCGHALVGPRE